MRPLLGVALAGLLLAIPSGCGHAPQPGAVGVVVMCGPLKRMLDKAGIDGTALGPVTVYNGPPTVQVERHERCHNVQEAAYTDRMGVPVGLEAFAQAYFAETMRVGYERNTFERQCRAAEAGP